MSTDKQINANRENAQHSTGPITEEGKEASAFNRFKHGLCGRFQMIEGESQTDYGRLLEWFLAEHPPEDTEEVALVSKMAEHFWLAQRAQVLQNDTLRNADYPGGYNYMNRQEQNARFALYMRYASSHERGFHKCQEKLKKIRKERENRQNGFERLKIQQAEEKRKQELHELKMAAAKAAEMKPAKSQNRNHQTSSSSTHPDPARPDGRRSQSQTEVHSGRKKPAKSGLNRSCKPEAHSIFDILNSECNR